MVDLFRRRATSRAADTSGGACCHGKLPTLGDFVTRGLGGAALERWDGWLQQLVSVSRAGLGPDWQAAWLRMPAWHFALGRSVLAGRPWAGVLIPSVDKVGRSYPFSVLSPMRPGGVPLAGWQGQAEALALEALEGGLDAALLQQRLDRIGCPRCESGRAGAVPADDKSVFWWHPVDADALPTLRTPGLPGPEHAQTLVLGRPAAPGQAGTEATGSGSRARRPRCRLPVPPFQDPAATFLAAPRSLSALSSAAAAACAAATGRGRAGGASARRAGAATAGRKGRRPAGRGSETRSRAPPPW